MNLLIIEDDLFLAERIGLTFKHTGNFNNIKLIHDFDGFLRLYHMILSYDIILVDIILSDDINDENNGFKIISKIREKSESIPIIIISGNSEIAYLEQGFDLGANDYLFKPFRLKELELRVDRWFKIYLFGNLKVTDQLLYNDLKKDLYSGNILYKGQVLNLTKKSKYILTLFLQEPEKLLSESYISDKIWGDISSIIERNPRVNINRLKSALSEYGIGNWINNVRGEGYILKINK